MKKKMAGLILAAVLASVLLSGCGSGTEQTSTESDDSYQEIELVMAVNGTDIQIDTKVAKKFAELVEEESGGRVTVAVFPNDQLAGGNSTKGIEMIAVGGADLAAYATSVMSVLDGQMSIATIPWSFDNYTEARTVIDETGGDYYAKVLEEKGITYLGSFHNGFRQISNSRHEVRTPEDVQGLEDPGTGQRGLYGLFPGTESGSHLHELERSIYRHPAGGHRRTGERREHHRLGQDVRSAGLYDAVELHL